MQRYEPSAIEPRWQAVWERDGVFRAVDSDADGRERFYKLHMFPYPSGDLHMGHAEAFAISDIIARYKWMRGFNVLHPIGWDAFGLPAENAAIQRGQHPKQWTYSNIEHQERSFKRYGMSFDWTRKLATSDPEYYRWTQWIFLQLYRVGLAYRKLAPTNWCPKDQTVLANEQVVNGRCERCGTIVVRKDLTQWFYKITDYADRLLDDMAELDWSNRVLNQQRNWIGRSHGAEVTFECAETGDRVGVHHPAGHPVGGDVLRVRPRASLAGGTGRRGRHVAGGQGPAGPPAAGRPGARRRPARERACRWACMP